MFGNKFAYGRDEVQSCKCPASSAGYSPLQGDSSTIVAEEYDSIVVTRFSDGDKVSVIREEKAKKAWLQAVEKMAQRYGEGSEFYQTAVDVAEELGWM